MSHILSFPGLGIPPFEINPIAFSLFGRDIAWYGIIVTVGILAAFCYTLWRGKRSEGISDEHIYDIGLFTVIFGIIGARAYYVLTNLDYYNSFSRMIAIWEGGLAIYGGIIAGALTILITTRIKKIDPRRFLDAVAPGVMLGQAIGRWGNFCNAEAHGIETTLPWRMGIYEKGAFVYYHPTFLYESLWNLLGFVLINLFYRRKKYNGQIVLLYVTWYGFGRMLIEGLRTDSLWIFNGTVRISQLVGFISFAAGLIALFVCGRIASDRRAAMANGDAVSPATVSIGEENSTAENAVTAAETDESTEKMTDESEETQDGKDH